MTTFDIEELYDVVISNNRCGEVVKKWVGLTKEEIKSKVLLDEERSEDAADPETLDEELQQGQEPLSERFLKGTPQK